VTIHLVSADTFGSFAETAAVLGLEAHRIGDGEDKRRVVDELGPPACAAVGNGLNDVPMLEASALAIAVTGPERASGRALAAADIVCRSIVEALDLLLDERARWSPPCVPEHAARARQPLAQSGFQKRISPVDRTGFTAPPKPAPRAWCQVR
jgi:hypothetical protein